MLISGKILYKLSQYAANSSDLRMASSQTKHPLDSESCLMPPSKKSKSETDSSRSFQEKWLNEFNWLKYEASTKQMFCTLFIKVQNSNTFTTGCVVMKKDNLTKHQKTKDHRDAMEASKLSTAMTKATVSATNKSETAIIAAMHNVYFAAKHDLPSSLIPDLNRLCMMQGATQLQDLVVDQHTTYEHNTSISDFQDCMAEVLRVNLKN
ncbi:uncharacterized protein LOC143244338 [Tachypleus tridentatus]|uniref:uncharacterized protein LOC143244338 n=1 Tax=Tachypleus tridentatus TaxID=6853 RepID=UPI003FD368C5